MDNLRKTKYLVVSSNDSLPYFPGNRPEAFTSVLTPSLELRGDWFVGLRQLWFELASSASTGMFICVDVYITQGSGTIVNGHESMLLRRVHTFVRKGMKVTCVTFDSCDMVPIRLPCLDRIELRIKPVQPDNISFGDQAITYATLVLKQQ